MEDAVKITAVAAFLFIVLLLLNYYESAFFGQFLTHSIQRMHSVAFFCFRELSVSCAETEECPALWQYLCS